MASIKKVQICGIRSFGPKEGDEQKIPFEKPLTVIIGRNGCGKSTIIEALRWVTSQKEPAGRGVFVHDPQLTDDNSVKGYVKLLIKDSKGENVTISKAMQATKIKSGVSTKTLDCTVTRKTQDAHGNTKNVSISSRCVDINAEVTRIFGVSRAILENVIFCSQEDSHWPLDADQKLKEKFDQIFDSEKYNKCLKKVLDEQKVRVGLAKKAQTELKYLEENKKAAANKRALQAKLESNIESLNAELGALDRELVPIEEKLRDIHKNEIELSKVHTVRETTRTELDMSEKQKKDLLKKIQDACCEFIGTDDDLIEAIKACDEKSQTEASLKQEFSKIEEAEKKIALKLRQNITEVSQLKKLLEINEEKAGMKQTKMNELAKTFGMESSYLSEDGLERRVQGKETEFRKLEEQHEAEEVVSQSEIDKAREELLSQENLVKMKQEAVDGNRQESKKLKRELEDVEASQAKLERVATSLRKATQDLNDHTRINNVEELKSDVRRWQTDLNQAEEQLASIEEDVRVLQEQTSIVKELELQRETLADKTAQIKRLRNNNEDSLREIFSSMGSVPESGFKRAVEAHASSLQGKLKGLQGSQSQKEKEVTTLEGKRKFLKESLREKETVLANSREQVFDATGGDPWSEKVQTMQREVDELQEEKGTLTSSSLMYQRYIRALQRPNPCCPLCTRDFAAEQDALRLAEDLREKMKDVPNRIERNKQELEGKQEILNRLLALQPIEERITALVEREIPSLNKELTEVETNYSRARRELDEIVRQKQKPEKDLKTCSDVQGDMALLDQYSSDRENAQREVDKLELRLPAGGPKHSLRETLARQDTLRHNRKLAKHNYDEAHARLNKYMDTLQTLQSEKHSLAEELRSLEGGGSSRKALEDRYCELQALDAVLMEELAAAREALYPLKEALNRALQNLKDLKEMNKNSKDGKRRELDGLKKQMEEIRRLQREIAEFQSKGVENKLKDLEFADAQLERDLKAEQIRKESISMQIGETAKIVVRRRELEDNKSLRQMTVKCAELREKLKEQDKKFGNMNYDALKREQKRLKTQEEDIGKDKAKKNGLIEALYSQVSSLKAELESKMFRTIDNDYKKELIESRVEEFVAADLFRYAKCMEYTMSVYHKTQMEKVNSFAREYWRKIYQGNDIEYIEIKTEECKVSEKRRAYNYRVVQVKNDVELDMRNRCSAGQKMLACLIIRMAVAEVFSGSCGILTLDEPTTNLDEKNIKTLARVLNEIITSKQMADHSNFQLIVITHDEMFLRELVEVNAVSSYVVVSRDSTAKSKIAIKTVSAS